MAGNLQSYGPVTLLGSGGRVKALQHAYARVLAPHPIMGNALLHASFSLVQASRKGTPKNATSLFHQPPEHGRQQVPEAFAFCLRVRPPRPTRKQICDVSKKFKKKKNRSARCTATARAAFHEKKQFE